jgi:hypothetical protein
LTVRRLQGGSEPPPGDGGLTGERVIFLVECGIPSGRSLAGQEE